MEKFDKMFKKVKNELERWTTVNSFSSPFIQGCFNKLEDFVIDPTLATLASLQMCSFWNQVNFVKLYIQNNTCNNDLFSKYLQYKVWDIKFILAFGQVYQGKNIILMTTFTDAISLSAISSQWKEYEQLCNTFLNVIDTEYMEKGMKTQKHSWFVIQLYCITYNIKLDTKILNYPKNLDVYEQAIEFWDSSDLFLVDKIIFDICNYHLDNSNQKMSAEFQDISLFVFPIEILGWLAVRKKAGLKNPNEYTHPMMQLNLNRIFEFNFTISQDEVLKRMVESFQERFPKVNLEI